MIRYSVSNDNISKFDTFVQTRETIYRGNNETEEAGRNKARGVLSSRESHSTNVSQKTIRGENVILVLKQFYEVFSLSDVAKSVWENEKPRSWLLSEDSDDVN